MSAATTDQLIEKLSRDAAPVRPLRSPASRAMLALAVLALLSGGVILALGDVAGLRARYAQRELLMAMEMLAMLATAVAAILAAFSVSIPGRSRRWIAAPLPFLVSWIALSGIGCLAQFRSSTGSEAEGSHCLLFILGASAVLAPWLVLRLARARPIDPMPVALLAGLGLAAMSAFTLQFFHAAPVTAVDLVVHLVAIALVVGVTGLLNRPLLGRP